MKKKTKKIMLIAGAAVAGAGAVTGGVTYIRMNGSKAVEVTDVASLNQADWISDDYSDGVSGTVVTDVSQNVTVPDNKVINEVYVSEGDTVKIGDKLLSYDTTLLELDEELQEITVMELGLEIKSAEADLKKLQSKKPGDKVLEDSGSNLDLTNAAEDASEDNDDSDDDEARLVTNQRASLAVQEDGSADTEENSADDQSTQADDSSTTDAMDTQPETQSDAETVIDDSADGKSEVLTPDDLDKAGQSESSDAADGTAETENQKKTNQSLEKLLTNIRVKSVSDQGETLLVDTEKEGSPTAAVDGALKLIPHFAETVNAHFEQDATYSMTIHGVTFSKDIEGKVYGIAKINGEDYPEIGGFTLVQTDAATHTAQLTIAFHDGLQEQHELSAELEDAYLEITLSADEMEAGDLTFRTKDAASDIVIAMEKPQAESESEITEETTAEEQADATIDVQADPGTEQTEEPENPDTEVTSDVTKVTFTVNWNHGNNSEQNWPEALKVYYYGDGQGNDPSYTFQLSQESSVTASTATGGQGGDDTVDEEATTEAAAESTESETETESTTEEATAPAEGITDTDTTNAQEFWKAITLELPSGSSIDWAKTNSESETYWWAYAANYTCSVSQASVDTTTGTANVTITMTYNQPAEDPLLKLNPISELTYTHGTNTLEDTGMRAYKGSGTAEDPYVFFVTDGVKITNTFVNWALGFNEDGTERIGDGYYIRLEIRESDTFTNAFIRSIDLDGTIPTETGYGPGTYWIFNSESGITKYEEDIPDPDNSGDGGGGWSNDNTGDTYTAEELAAAIKEKEREVRKLKLDEREAELKLKKYKSDIEDSTVTSAVNGYVEKLNGEVDGEPYMVVSSAGGLYVQTTVDELDLDSIAVDQEILCYSWMTSDIFYATITEIDKFPASENGSNYYFGSSGNTNSSSYPVLAVISEDTQESGSVSEYDSVSVTYTASDESTSGKIYLEKAYIRSENGQSYVYIADENDKLKKQYIKTGSNTWGYVEIKQGLSEDDRLAFPYGKNVKEGAPVKDADSEDDE